tara:strand:- start:78 stop:233 length:156 start_codon:yes stop_codon:yes gene_type:complete
MAKAEAIGYCSFTFISTHRTFISANTDKFDIGVSRLDQNMKRIVEKSIRTR